MTKALTAILVGSRTNAVLGVRDGCSRTRITLGDSVAPIRSRSAFFCASVCAQKNADLDRSEELTSELQSRLHLVCRLLLEKKQNLTALPLSITHLTPRASVQSRESDLALVSTASPRGWAAAFCLF